MKCAVTTCQNEADPKLVHRYTGKTYCASCARAINQWDSRQEVVPFPKRLELNDKPGDVRGFIEESTDG